MRLRVATPVKSRVQLIKDGRVTAEVQATQEKDWLVQERGVYRVEVYLDDLPAPLNSQPWIISNPIYVR